MFASHFLGIDSPIIAQLPTHFSTLLRVALAYHTGTRARDELDTLPDLFLVRHFPAAQGHDVIETSKAHIGFQGRNGSSLA
jgi:hypothetical protein